MTRKKRDVRAFDCVLSFVEETAPPHNPHLQSYRHNFFFEAITSLFGRAVSDKSHSERYADKYEVCDLWRFHLVLSFLNQGLCFMVVVRTGSIPSTSATLAGIGRLRQSAHASKASQSDDL